MAWLRAKINPLPQGIGRWRNGIENIQYEKGEKSKEGTSSSGGTGGDLVIFNSKKDKGRLSEEDSDSYSPLARKLVIGMRDKEGKHRIKRKKGKGMLEYNEISPSRQVRRKVSKGESPSKVVAGEQPHREP